jgi:hypothetical protein
MMFVSFSAVVMPGLDPSIHQKIAKQWIAGSSPAMTFV